MNLKSKRTIILAGFSILFFNIVVGQELSSLFVDNSIEFSNGLVSLKNGLFKVVIESDGNEIELVPWGDPVIVKNTRKTPEGLAHQTTYSWTDYRGFEYSWIISEMSKDLISVRANFLNTSIKPVRLKHFQLINTPKSSLTVQGEASDWMLATTSIECRRWGTLNKDIPTSQELEDEGAYSSFLFKRRTVKDPEKFTSRKWRSYHNDMTLYKEPGINGITLAAADTVSYVYFDMKVEDTNIKLEVTSDMNVLVDPGESRKSDEVLIISKPWGESQKLRNNWLLELTRHSVTKKPLYGWCSWYRQKLGFDEQVVKNVVDHTANHYNNIPFEVIQLDDHFQNNDIDWDANEKFSSGISAMAKTITDKGMVAGIWMCPGTVNNQKTEGLKGILDARFTEDCFIGKSYFGRIKTDPTHPTVREYIRKTLQKKKAEGYTYFKLDFTQWPLRAEKYYNPKMTAFQVQRDLYRQYRDAVGDECYIMSCGMLYQRPIFDFIDATRIGTDCGPMGGFARRPLAADKQPREIHGFWYPIVAMVNKTLENGVLSNADPDVAYVGQTGKTRPKHLQTFHSFIGTYGGFALTSEQMFRPEFDTNDNLRMLEIMYPIVEEKPQNFAAGWDMFGREFGTTVNRSFGNSMNLIIWNPEHKNSVDLTIKNVPVETIGEKFHAWSFWDEKYIGVIEKNYVAEDIPPYEHQLLRLTALSDNPVVLGSNLHIAMGASEIMSIKYIGTEMKIELDPNAGARSGRIYIYSKQALNNAKSSNSNIYIAEVEENIYVLVLSNRNRDKNEVITLEVGKRKALSVSKAMKDKNFKNDYSQSSFTEEWSKSW